MLIYSENINLFRKKILVFAKEIMKNEMGLDVQRSRIKYNSYFYPLNIVVFEKENTLGYFDSHTYQIGINRKLMYLAKTDVIKNILRHELAHFLTFLKFGNQETAHGENFKAICHEMGWSKDVSMASADLRAANSHHENDIASEKLINRVKKLLSLATSDNSHEAQSATLKANQLLLKHHLNYKKIDNDEKIYVKRVLEFQKNTAKYHCIYEILKHFFVAPVFNYGKGIAWLEVTGAKTNIEIAEYVANFLDYELDALWIQNKKENPDMKGAQMKNSFMHGIANGYDEKMNLTNKTLDPSESKLLQVVRNDLKSKLNLVYGSLSSVKSQAKTNSSSRMKGLVAGRNLNIKSSIKNRTNKLFFLQAIK